MTCSKTRGGGNSADAAPMCYRLRLRPVQTRNRNDESDDGLERVGRTPALEMWLQPRKMRRFQGAQELKKRRMQVVAYGSVRKDRSILGEARADYR